MLGVRWTPLNYIFLLLSVSTLVLSIPHGDDEMEGMGGMGGMNSTIQIEWSESFSKPSYFRHPEYKFWIWSHITSMVLAWFIALPLGKRKHNSNL
jgi:hypothetical protein